MSDHYRGSTWLGPYDLDGDILYIHRFGPNSAPHDLPRANSRLWELLEADFDDPSRPRPGGRATRIVTPNDVTDAEGVRRLLGGSFPVVFKPGWGEDGPA